MGSEKRFRRPAAVNLLAGLVLLVAIAFPALRPTQPPPPVVAEFAPVVRQAIKSPQPAPVGPVGAATGQAGVGGQGTGGTGAGGGPSGSASVPGRTPIPTPTQSAAPPPASKPCAGFGNPPRTTPDPQSPECVPYWNGNNGGSTSPGVTGSNILVANAFTRDQAIYPNYAQDLVNYFYAHFQTYGRTVTLYNYNVSNGEGPATTAQMSQDAATVKAVQPFADMGYKLDNNGQSYYFYDQLAAAHIISLEQTYTDPAAVGEDHFAQKAPYEWTFLPPAERVLANVGNFTCQSLGIGAGHLATFAGAPLNQQQRKVGVAKIVDITAPNTSVDESPLVSRLQSCGGVDGPFKLTADGTNNRDTFDCSSALRQFIKDGVTTMIVVGQTNYLGQCMNQADGLSWRPEWIASNIYEQDNDQATQYYAERSGSFNEATGHLMGVQSFNKSLPIGSRYSQNAGQSLDPAYREPIYPDVYYNLMMLFAGIQYAGPNLTPQSFQDGLFRAMYPNPGAGGPPSYESRLGAWGPNRHAQVEDFAPIWFSPTEKAPDGTLPYSWCYVDHGARYSGTGWPDLTGKLFKGQCH